MSEFTDTSASEVTILRREMIAGSERVRALLNSITPPPAAGDVLVVRMPPADQSRIAAVQRALGLPSQAATLRHLLREGLKAAGQ